MGSVGTTKHESYKARRIVAEGVGSQNRSQPTSVAATDRRKCQILKTRRDVRVVEGARLESVSPFNHRVTWSYLLAE